MENNRPGISSLKGQGHFHFAKGTSTGKSLKSVGNFQRGTEGQRKPCPYSRSGLVSLWGYWPSAFTNYWPLSGQWSNGYFEHCTRMTFKCAYRVEREHQVLDL